jgi:hypothetical protein
MKYYKNHDTRTEYKILLITSRGFLLSKIPGWVWSMLDMCGAEVGLRVHGTIQ